MSTDQPHPGLRGSQKKSARQSRGRNIKRSLQLYFIIALPMAFLATFNYLPMAGVQIAFRDYNPVDGTWGSPWIGLEQFEFFVNGPYFWPILRNTLTLGIYSLAVGTPAAIILALAINELKHARYKRIVQMVTYAPYFISTVVIVGMINLIFSTSSGPYGRLMQAIGIESPPEILASPAAFSSIYVWSGVWQETGYAAVIYLAALSAVNPELYEAARIDGASRIQRIWHVDLPAITPTIIVLMILSVGNVMNIGFEKVFLLQNPLNLSQSEVIPTYVYRTGLLDANFSFAAAVGLFNSLVGLVLLVLVNLIARAVSGKSLF